MADLKIRIRSIEGCEPCTKALEFCNKLKDNLRGIIDLDVEKIDETLTVVAEAVEKPGEVIPFKVPIIEIEGECGKKEVVGFGDDAKTEVMEAMKNVLCIGKKTEESESKA